MVAYRALSALRRCGIKTSRSCHASTVAASAGASLMCVGMSVTKTRSYHNCMAEANPQTNNNRRRKRPPTFGTTVPTITKRGITTGIGKDIASVALDDREDCPMCKKFGSGPCGDIFKQWLNCTDKHPGKDANGEPLHLTHCSELAEKLAKCLDTHAGYYTSKDNEGEIQQQEKPQSQETDTMKAAWSEFVSEMEDGIKANTFTTSPFPEKCSPSMQFKPSSKIGAAIFAPDVNGASIITAYILDDNDNVLAAGSKEDMDMGNFGCVLQFDVLDESMKSATCRAIYDSDDTNVTIFTRTTLVPK
eukprot:scaffold480_cov127-Skeletonema_dohrnii-CCMP3373.AAC.3